ncbi:HAD family hydrolase [Alteromonas sp. 5E99-2]|uniref:HAD family hydrolase n=1 Tax=Alteromonas sp. 5E99-2 TaxID=2817683 RepID=UPI001A97DD78|nr:HAD family hydrolase [Alteromonas sp. 5E99-2]MBO1255665.1 HAD family hydrolase [Alteromonas sp. 5E99-2]
MTNPCMLHSQQQIELIIFDCDGVLVDSEVLSQRVLTDMLEPYGISLSSSYFYTHFLGYSFEHVAAKIKQDFSVSLPSEFRYTFRNKLKEVFHSELVPTTGVIDMLSQLQIKSCVATSGSPEKVTNSLLTTRLSAYFLGKVFTSSEVKKGKPAPDLFLHSAHNMGVAAENCLVIEDSRTGVEAAIAANMNVVRYVGASHLKDRDVNDTDYLGDICKISHWRQLFIKYPSLNSSFNMEK